MDFLIKKQTDIETEIKDISVFVRQLQQLWNLGAIIPVSDQPSINSIQRAEIRLKEFRSAIPQVCLYHYITLNIKM